MYNIKLEYNWTGKNRQKFKFVRCFANFFLSKNLSEFGKILGYIFWKVWKDFKVSKERFRINFSSIFLFDGMLTITV